MSKFKYGIQFVDNAGTVYEMFFGTFKDALSNVSLVKSFNPKYINVRSLDGITTLKIK